MVHPLLEWVGTATGDRVALRSRIGQGNARGVDRATEFPGTASSVVFPDGTATCRRAERCSGSRSAP